MKRLFFILVAAIMAASLMAEGHMKFKGVEIDGNPQEFVQKLTAMGYKYEKGDAGVIIMSGSFAGYNKCFLLIRLQNDIISQVSVSFNERDNWNGLYADYSHLKALLIEKYGEPAAVSEEWMCGYTPKDDERKLQEITSWRTQFISVFLMAEGGIALETMPIDESHATVLLTYYDNQNGGKIKNRAIKDL